MSSTNTTPNYGLPQYIPTDKPTYLGDFNKAMLDIDTNIKTIENKAVSAESSVATANSNASQALENANQASTKADTAQAASTQAQKTATTAKNTADTANSTANRNTNSINNIKKWTEPQNIVNSEFTGSSLKCSYNKELGLLNLYGKFNILRNNPNNIILGTLPEEIRPTNTRTIINGFTPVYPIGSAGDGAGIPADLTINPQGQIVLYNNGVGAPTTLNYGFIQLMLNISDWKK